MPDLECSWWPDSWFGLSITDCCIAHDLGASDSALAACVADKGGPAFLLLAIVMFAGVKLGRPIYRALSRRR